MNAKTYLLAGGNSGVGRATAELLRAKGHRVISAGRNAEALKDADTLEFDATNSVAELPLPETLDGLVYFPGTITLKSFRALKDDDFRRDMEVNFFGAVRFLRAALPALQKAENAAIVLFSTVAVQTGMPFHASIAAAKGAVEGFARALAAELAPKVRVNCIAPSLTATPLAANLLSSDAKTQASRERHPLKRLGDPAETAQLVRFLLSDAAGFITGQVIGVDGGLSSLRTT
ncbi:MAG: SDR family NAD(P)-dependent oxidoreductase [Chthoniobacterales bacterium]